MKNVRALNCQGGRNHEEVLQGLLTEISCPESAGATRPVRGPAAPRGGQPLRGTPARRRPQVLPPGSFSISSPLQKTFHFWSARSTGSRGASLRAARLLGTQTLPVPPPSPATPRLWGRLPSAVSQGGEKSSLQDEVGTGEVPGGTRVRAGGRRDRPGAWGAAMAPQAIPAGRGRAARSAVLASVALCGFFPEKHRFSAALTCFAFTGVTRKES